MECVDCLEIVTTPLCNLCISTSITEWLLPYEMSVWGHSGIVDGEGSCMRCSASVLLCIYCYTKDVYEYFFELCPKLATEFLEYFHFDLEKKGYAKVLYSNENNIDK